MKSTITVLFLMLAFATRATALTLTVTSAADPGDGVCDAVCTLREAISAANSSLGADVINFNIPGTGLHTITPTTPLPALAGGMTIDGYTQPGASPNTLAAGNNAVLKIELRGVSVGASANGLTVNTNNCVIRGLVVNRFPSSGIRITGDRNRIEGNYIGTDAGGILNRGNDVGGVVVTGDDNVVGGSLPGARNVISGNSSDGIQLRGPASRTVVQGNFIGLDATGSADLGNASTGIKISNCTLSTIGGTTIAARNIISGNDHSGVQVDQSSSETTVQGNYIGTDVTGSGGLGNAQSGVHIGAATNTRIGGSVAGAGNLLSGNAFGVQLFDANASGTVIQGNKIGTNAAGTGPLGNSTGILLFHASTEVGGPGAAGNTIAFNSNTGVAINASSSGNTLLGNSIHSNGRLGIDLSGGMEDANSVTANDFPDSDVGANGLQNYPVLTRITAAGNERAVEGELRSNATTNYTLEFFSNGQVDPSGYGEGETCLGVMSVQTDALATATFSFPLGTGSKGRFITATATDPSGNTSEFSMASAVVPPRSQFLNISTRLRVQTGNNVLIGGFIITGNVPKQVIVRAIGPSLGGLGVANPLANPILELNYPDGTVVTNDNWRATQEAAIIATGVPPTDNLESAIVATLNPGAYTAIVRGVNGGTGVGLVETYDLSTGVASVLANISTRGLVETGDNVMIGGIIVGPNTAPSGSILLRGIGPSLGALGVPNALADPMLELRNGNGSLIMSNNNWRSTQEAAIQATGVAPTDDREAAIIATLAAGSYTAILSGVGGTTGVGLVEAYHLD